MYYIEISSMKGRIKRCSKKILQLVTKLMLKICWIENKNELHVLKKIIFSIHHNLKTGNEAKTK